MKVIGTGSPVMLTIRVRTSEVGLFRDVLNEQLLAALGSLDQAAACDGRAARADGQANGELAVVSELLNQLREPVAADQPRELVGPTSVLDPVIRTAASEAVDRLSEAVDVFRSDRGGEASASSPRGLPPHCSPADSSCGCATPDWLVLRARREARPATSRA
jgi:hypothetical protein